MVDATDFYFQWPWAFWGLLLLPLLTILYLRIQRTRWRQAFQFSQTSLLAALDQQLSPWKRLLLPVSTLLLLLLLILALARPTIVTKVPTRSVQMMLVLDISLSMMAEDIKPNRIQAAKDAGIRFVESLPRDVSVGLTLFAGNTYVVTPPLRDHHQVANLLKSLKVEDLQPRTEIGSAIEASLKTLTPRTEAPKKSPPQRVIILLSDGDSREGYPWNLAAQEAKKQRVSIYTVGVGSPGDTSIVYQGQVLPVTFSETTLKEIARLAGGEYFRVFSERDFQQVYTAVRDRSIDYEERPEDLGYLLSLGALLVLISTIFASLFWVRRVF